MKLRTSTLFIFLIVFVFNTKAQDPLFANTQQSLLYLNPSFAGSNGFIRNQFAFRNQWPNLSGTLVTYLNSFDAYIKPIRGGLGLSVSVDDQDKGTLKTTRLDLTYAQHFYLMEGKLKIIPSIQATYLQLSLDKTKLNFGNPINSRYGMFWNYSTTSPTQNKKNVDFSSGLLINYKNFYFGSTIFHFNQPDIGLLGSFKLPYRLSIHSSYNFHISEKMLLNFFVNYQSQQNLHYLFLNVNALLAKHFIVGTGLKSFDNINLNVGYRHNFFSITYGYDVVVSKLSGNRAGSHEVLASFNLRNKEQRKLVTDFEKW
jgi:type IX secretion system PorP/SprF family membrane protein